MRTTCSADTQGLSVFETHCTKPLTGGGKTLCGLKLPAGGTAGKQIRD